MMKQSKINFIECNEDVPNLNNGNEDITILERFRGLITIYIQF